jgi:hypothetical protein
LPDSQEGCSTIMPEANKQAQNILSRFKGLDKHLDPDEEPVSSLPAIWDGGQTDRGETCEVILTNQRLIGFYFRSFPREKLFFDALQLSQITNVTFRQKSHEPIFRELMVIEGKRKIYIRAPRRQIEALYTTLRSATAAKTAQATAPAPQNDLDREQPAHDEPDNPKTTSSSNAPVAPIYGRQEMSVPFESSTLAVMLLFTGGIILETVGVFVWSGAGSSIGMPLCIAGFVAVCSAILVQRQRRKQHQ